MMVVLALSRSSIKAQVTDGGRKGEESGATLGWSGTFYQQGINMCVGEPG